MRRKEQNRRERGKRQKEREDKRRERTKSPQPCIYIKKKHNSKPFQNLGI